LLAIRETGEFPGVLLSTNETNAKKTIRPTPEVLSMASAESQGKTIALVVTIVMFVGAAATAYYFFDKVTAAENGRAEAIKQKNDAEAQARKITENYSELRSMALGDNLGNADHAKVKELIATKLNNPNSNPPKAKNATPRKASYDTMLAAIESNNALVASLDRTIAASEETVGNLTKQLTSSSSVYNDKVNQVGDDLKKKTAELNRVVQDDTQRLEEQNQRINDASDRALRLNTELEQLRRSSTEQIEQLKKNNDRLLLIIDMVQQRQRRGQETKFNTEDGSVVQVLGGGQEAYLNIGKLDGVGQGLTFGIYGTDRTGFTQSLPKANVEITRILGDHQSLGRISGYKIEDPVVPGDKIYNPIWDRGRKTGVAILGLVDIDGDGRYDNEEFKRLIERWGGRVDAEVDFKSLKAVGRITIDTDWLIEGKIPDPAEAGEVEAADAAAIRTAINTAAQKFRTEARQHSVRPVNVHNFIAFMGYTPIRKTQAAGEEELVRALRHKQKTQGMLPNPDSGADDVDIDRLRSDLQKSGAKKGENLKIKKAKDNGDAPAKTKDDGDAPKKKSGKKSSDDSDL
jgi:hypothetical protein